MRLSRGEHELARAFDRVERDLLVFSRRLFQMRKEIEYLRSSLTELAEYAKLARIGTDLAEIHPDSSAEDHEEDSH